MESVARDFAFNIAVLVVVVIAVLAVKEYLSARRKSGYRDKFRNDK